MDQQSLLIKRNTHWTLNHLKGSERFDKWGTLKSLNIVRNHRSCWVTPGWVENTDRRLPIVRIQVYHRTDILAGSGEILNIHAIYQFMLATITTRHFLFGRWLLLNLLKICLAYHYHIWELSPLFSQFCNFKLINNFPGQKFHFSIFGFKKPKKPPQVSRCLPFLLYARRSEDVRVGGYPWTSLACEPNALPQL